MACGSCGTGRNRAAVFDENGRQHTVSYLIRSVGVYGHSVSTSRTVDLDRVTYTVCEMHLGPRPRIVSPLVPEIRTFVCGLF